MEIIGGSVRIIKIAITGNLASGKSSVCRFFKEHGAYVVNADAIVHDLISRDSECIQKIVELLGNKVIAEGQIRRDLVADMVFSDQKLLYQLEKILHPRVAKTVEETYEKVKEKYPLFVAEIPLLFESEADHFFDYIVAVEANPSLAEERFVAKGYTREDYQQRMKRQLSIEEIKKRSDFVITNNGSLENIRVQVETIINQMRS